MLQFGKERAHQLVQGAAYAANESMKNYQQNPAVEKRLEKYSSVHGLPEQRFYNFMCVPYCADPKTFADVVESGSLPKRRAGNCSYEYETFSKAWRVEISPHIDLQMARVVLDTTWLPQSGSGPLPR
jgi:Putative metallopeptidase